MAAYNPYARQLVYDWKDVSHLRNHSLDEVVDVLKGYLEEGYTNLEVNHIEDRDGGSVNIKVVRPHLETDEEYAARMEQRQAHRDRLQQERDVRMKLYLERRKKLG